MIIILEGPDGTGKTTLAKCLSDTYGFRYVHTGPPKDDNALEAYGRTLYDARREAGDVVIDRLHVGERIYGPILRSSDKLEREGEVLIHRLTSAYGARLIFCLPPYETAFENWRKRHEEDNELVTKAATYKAIYHAYANLRQDIFYSSALWWDYTMMDVKTSAEVLVYLTKQGDVCPIDVIGSPSAKFLFVGEQANQEYLDLPFFALNGSSRYLNDCIEDAGYQENEIAFVNAKRLNGSGVHLSAIHKTLKEPKVIALGNVSRDLLGDQGVPHVYISHPAYWKRFYSTRRDEYVKRLRDIRIGTYNLSRKTVP